MATITGSEVLAKALRTQGVDTMFYLMGGPMLETEAACSGPPRSPHDAAASLAASPTRTSPPAAPGRPRTWAPRTRTHPHPARCPRDSSRRRSSAASRDRDRRNRPAALIEADVTVLIRVDLPRQPREEVRPLVAGPLPRHRDVAGAADHESAPFTLERAERVAVGADWRLGQLRQSLRGLVLRLGKLGPVRGEPLASLGRKREAGTALDVIPAALPSQQIDDLRFGHQG